jgi:hypothetical protein
VRELSLKQRQAIRSYLKDKQRAMTRDRVECRNYLAWRAEQKLAKDRRAIEVEKYGPVYGPS